MPEGEIARQVALHCATGATALRWPFFVLKVWHQSAALWKHHIRQAYRRFRIRIKVAGTRPSARIAREALSPNCRVLANLLHGLHHRPAQGHRPETGARRELTHDLCVPKQGSRNRDRATPLCNGLFNSTHGQPHLHQPVQEGQNPALVTTRRPGFKRVNWCLNQR